MFLMVCSFLHLRKLGLPINEENQHHQDFSYFVFKLNYLFLPPIPHAINLKVLYFPLSSNHMVSLLFRHQALHFFLSIFYNRRKDPSKQPKSN